MSAPVFSPLVVVTESGARYEVAGSHVRRLAEHPCLNWQTDRAVVKPLDGEMIESGAIQVGEPWLFKMAEPWGRVRTSRVREIVLSDGCPAVVDRVRFALDVL